MRKVILFGAGSFLSNYIEMLEKVYDILFICDNNSEIWDTQYFYNDKKEPIKIKSPEVLTSFQDVDVMITSMYEEEIRNQLRNMGMKKISSLYGMPIGNDDYKHRINLMEYIKKSGKAFSMSRGYDGEKAMKRIRDVYYNWNNHFEQRFIFKNTLPYMNEKDNKILDFGCGCGTLVFYLLLNGYDAYGIDVDTEKWNFICQKIDDLGYPQEWKEHFILYDGEKICFDNKQFDVVLCDYVLEHVNNHEICINEMFRVCKNGGLVHISCPDYDNTFEEHFFVDFGKPLKENKKEFRNYISMQGGNSNDVDELNFVNKKDILNALEHRGEIIDLDSLIPTKYNRVDFLVRKGER